MMPPPAKKGSSKTPGPGEDDINQRNTQEDKDNVNGAGLSGRVAGERQY